MTNKLKSSTLDTKNFGLNLYKIRTEKRLTRQWLADRLGYESQRIIYDYESGVKLPKLENAIKIAIILEVDLNSMFL